MNEKSTFLKGNISSTDNTLAFPHFNPLTNTYTQPAEIRLSHRRQNPTPPDPSLITEYNKIMNSNFDTSNRLFPQLNTNTPNRSNKVNTSRQQNTLEVIRANSDIHNFEKNNQNTNADIFHSSSSEFFNYQAPTRTQPIKSNIINNLNNNQDDNKNNQKLSDQDLRNSINFFTKQAYKKDLDKQVADHQSAAKALKLSNNQNDLELIKHYPFGARTDPSSYLNHNNSQNNSYQMNSHNVNGHPLEYRPNPDRNYKYDRNNIVEKPNSMNSDLPSYDPIKHRYGVSNSNDYDPWGKPGGGAPLIDNDTGKKSTKITGQVWYDKIGVFPDERQKHYSDKVRILPIDEQKRLMEEEISRKRDERDSVYKPFLDVSSWISGFERLPPKYGAHLNHTNVTREKLDVETVRKNDNPLLSNSYHKELGKQMEEKERQKKLSKLKEDIAGIEHTKKWDKLWGRPGAGAPNGSERRLKKVIGTLESPRVGHYDPTYGGKSLAMSDSYVNDSNERDKHGNLLYTKTIRHSNHTNLYDNEPPMKILN